MGSPSEVAVASPVMRLEQPGPEVTNATPGLAGQPAHGGSHEGCVRLMAHYYGVDGGVFQRIEHPIDLGPRNTEYLLDALRLQVAHNQFGPTAPVLIFHDNDSLLSEGVSLRRREWRGPDRRD
jgi:hypothetical protein